MRGITRAIPNDETDPGFCCPQCGRGKLYEQPYGFMFPCCKEAFAARIREVAQAALAQAAHERAAAAAAN